MVSLAVNGYAQARAVVKPARKGPRCTMGLLLDSLSAADRRAVVADMLDPNVLGTTIRKSLDQMGCAIAQHVVDRHRRMVRGETGCGCS